MSFAGEQELWNKFQRWHQLAQEQARFQRVAGRMLRRMVNWTLARTFALYREHTKEQKRHRTVCNRIMRHWKNQSAGKAFDAWLQVLLVRMSDVTACGPHKWID